MGAINQVKKMPAVKESEIQRMIKEYLQIKGFYVFKIHQSLGSHPGIADLYAMKDGFQVWIEVKTAKSKGLSIYQKEFRDNILRQGGNFLMARSVEDVQKYLMLFIK